MSRLDSRLLRALDDWLFPERVACLCCDAALGGDDQSGLCPGCAQALSRLAGEIEALPPPAGIDEALAAFPYADQPRQLILMLKFNSVRAAALPLARAMSSLPLGVYDALVPVPTTRRRLRQPQERFSPQVRRGSGWLRRQKRLATRAAHCLRPCGSCPLLCRFYAENKKLCKSACNFFSLRL